MPTGQALPDGRRAPLLAGSVEVPKAEADERRLLAGSGHALVAPSADIGWPQSRFEPQLRRTTARSCDRESNFPRPGDLAQFIEASARASVERRRMQAEFIARGLASRDETRRTGEYVDADVVLGNLLRKLDAARTRLAKKGK